MQIKKVVLTLVFIFLLPVIVSGCTSSQKTTLTPEFQTKSASTRSSEATERPSIVEATISPSEKPTRIPTLEAEEAYGLLQDIFKGSEGCQLPCWGGIIPGKTTNMEAERIMDPIFHVIYSSPSFEYKGFQYSGPGGGRGFEIGNVEVSFISGWIVRQGDDIIERLHIEGDVRKKGEDGITVYGDEAYNQMYQEYSLQGILSQHGIPSEVWMFAYLDDPSRKSPYMNPEEFQVLLQYDKGIFIEYMMPLKRIGENRGTACPTESIFDMWLVSPLRSEYFREQWSSYTTGSPDFAYSLPPEKVINMTSDEFYDEFSRSDSNSCFEIPLTIWPEH